MKSTPFDFSDTTGENTSASNQNSRDSRTTNGSPQPAADPTQVVQIKADLASNDRTTILAALEAVASRSELRDESLLAPILRILGTGSDVESVKVHAAAGSAVRPVVGDDTKAAGVIATILKRPEDDRRICLGAQKVAPTCLRMSRTIGWVSALSRLINTI